MATTPTGLRKPPGVVVRPSPDWFYDDCARGGALVTGDGVHGFYVGLFNNGASGQTLFVYGFASTFNSSKLFSQLFSVNAPGSTLVGPGQPIVAGGPMLAGVIYSGPSTDFAFADTAPVSFFAENIEGPLNMYTAPIAVLLPGWMLCVVDTGVTNVGAAAFYWQVILENPG